MYSYAAHESRNLKQARPFGQDVDLLRIAALATPLLSNLYHILQITISFSLFPRDVAYN